MKWTFWLHNRWILSLRDSRLRLWYILSCYLLGTMEMYTVRTKNRISPVMGLSNQLVCFHDILGFIPYFATEFLLCTQMVDWCPPLFYTSPWTFLIASCFYFNLVWHMICNQNVCPQNQDKLRLTTETKAI